MRERGSKVQQAGSWCLHYFVQNVLLVFHYKYAPKGFLKKISLEEKCRIEKTFKEEFLQQKFRRLSIFKSLQQKVGLLLGQLITQIQIK